MSCNPNTRKLYYILFSLISVVIAWLITLLFSSGSLCSYSSLDNLLLSDDWATSITDIVKGYEIPTAFKMYIPDHGSYIDKTKLQSHCPINMKDLAIALNNQQKTTNDEDIKSRKIKIKSAPCTDDSSCGCIPISSKMFTTYYLCTSIGLGILLGDSKAAKKSVEAGKGIDNFCLGEIELDASKKIVKFILNLIQGLVLYTIIRTWIIIISLSVICLVISGNVPVKKPDRSYYFKGKNPGWVCMFYILGLVITLGYWIIPFIIQLVCGYYYKYGKLNLFKYIKTPVMKVRLVIGIFFGLILWKLMGLLGTSLNGMRILKIDRLAKSYFAPRDKPFVDKIVNSVRIQNPFHLNYKLPSGGVFKKLFSILLDFTPLFKNTLMITVLVYCLALPYFSNVNNSPIGFGSSIFKGKRVHLVIAILMFVLVIFTVFQSREGENGINPIKECGENNYVYTEKFKKEEFWNLTSGFWKMNYCCFPAE